MNKNIQALLCITALCSVHASNDTTTILPKINKSGQLQTNSDKNATIEKLKKQVIELQTQVKSLQEQLKKVKSDEEDGEENENDNDNNTSTKKQNNNQQNIDDNNLEEEEDAETAEDDESEDVDEESIATTDTLKRKKKNGILSNIPINALDKLPNSKQDENDIDASTNTADIEKERINSIMLNCAKQINDISKCIRQESIKATSTLKRHFKQLKQACDKLESLVQPKQVTSIKKKANSSAQRRNTSVEQHTRPKTTK